MAVSIALGNACFADDHRRNPLLRRCWLCGKGRARECRRWLIAINDSVISVSCRQPQRNISRGGRSHFWVSSKTS